MRLDHTHHKTPHPQLTPRRTKRTCSSQGDLFRASWKTSDNIACDGWNQWDEGSVDGKKTVPACRTPFAAGTGRGTRTAPPRGLVGVSRATLVGSETDVDLGQHAARRARTLSRIVASDWHEPEGREGGSRVSGLNQAAAANTIWHQCHNANRLPVDGDRGLGRLRRMSGRVFECKMDRTQMCSRAANEWTTPAATWPGKRPALV